MQSITVQIKTVYGVDKVYPVCEKAKLLAKLAESVTLTERAIEHIKALGYTINVQSNHNQTL